MLAGTLRLHVPRRLRRLLLVDVSGHDPRASVARRVVIGGQLMGFQHFTDVQMLKCMLQLDWAGGASAGALQRSEARIRL